MKKITKQLLTSTLAISSVFIVGYSALNINSISNNIYSSVDTSTVESYATQPSDAQKGIYTNSSTGSTIQYNYYIETIDNGQTVDNSYLGLELQGEIPTSVIDIQTTTQTAADDVVWYGVSLQGGSATYETEKLINYNSVMTNGSNNNGTTHYIGVDTDSEWTGNSLEYQGTTAILNFNTTTRDESYSLNTNYINKELNTLEEDTQYTFKIYLDNQPFYDNTPINTVKSTTTMWFEFSFTTPALEDVTASANEDVAVITNNVDDSGDELITDTETTRADIGNGANDDIVSLNFNTTSYLSRNAKSENDFEVVKGPEAGHFSADVTVGESSTGPDAAGYLLTDVNLYVTGILPSFVTSTNPTFEYGIYVINEDGTDPVPANNEIMVEQGTATAYEDQNGYMVWSNQRSANGFVISDLMKDTNYTVQVLVDDNNVTENNLGTVWFEFNFTTGNTTLDQYSTSGTTSKNGNWLDAILADPASPWSIGLITTVSLLIVTVLGLSIALYGLHHHYHKNRVNERLYNQQKDINKQVTQEAELKIKEIKSKSRKTKTGKK